MKRETLERVGKISLLVFRALLITFVGIFFFYRCRLPITELDAEIERTGLSAANAIVSFLLFQTVVRTMHVHDARARSRALSEGKASGSFFGNFRYIFTDLSFWLDYAVFFLITLPFVDLPPYFHFRRTLLYALPESTPALAFLTVLITQLLFFLATLIGHNSARRAWVRYEEQKMLQKAAKAKGGEIGWRKAARQKKREERREIASIAIDLIIAFAVYSIAPAGIFAPVLLAAPIIIFFWYFSGLFTFFLLYLALFFGGRYLRGIKKRRDFVRKLMRICKEKEIPLSPIKHPYLSLFRAEPGENFSVVYKGQRYDCKLLGSFSRTTPILLSPDGYAIRRRTFHIGLRNIPVRYMGTEGAEASIQSISEPLFSIDRETNLDFSREGKKVVILLPIPHAIFVINEVGGIYPLDTGDRVGDYRVYNASGFLGAIERDFLGRH